MSTPPSTPPPPGWSGGPGQPPYPPGDPRNTAPSGPFTPDPRLLRQQAKAWRNYQRDAAKQQSRAFREQGRRALELQRTQLRAWRRGTRAQSIIGPLLLIGVATAALLVYNGRLPLYGLLDWFARWWPLILIAAGLLRLVEWAIARHQSESRGIPMRFAIGGGTVWLLILLSFLGLTAQTGIHRFGDHWSFGWAGDNLNQIFGSKHEEDSSAVTHTIAANGTLEIHSDHGDVTVDGTSDDGLVHIAEHKEVFTNDDSKAPGLFASLAPQFSGDDNNLILRVAGSQNSSATLNLTVPRGVHIVLNCNHGDVNVHSFHAPVSLTANRGDIDLSAIDGAVDVRSNSRHGDIQIHSIDGAVQLAGSGDEVNLNDIRGTVAVNGDFFGSGHLQHISNAVQYNAGRIGFSAARIDGEISFDEDDEFTARGVAGPLTVQTRSRNLTLERVSGAVQVTNSSGRVDITVAPPAGPVTVNNRDGDVSLSLPGSAKFTLVADTTDGTVQSEFPGAEQSTRQLHHGNLTATVGSGGPPIRLVTTHGNIQLQRNEMSALPPISPLPPLTNFPASARQSLLDAQKGLAEAQEEMKRAQQEAASETRAGLAEGNRERVAALAEAAKAVAEAQKEAARATADSLKEAAQARAESQKEAAQARSEAAQGRAESQKERADALKEAAQARAESQKEAAEARSEARKEAAAARKEAEAEREAARKARSNPPAPPTAPPPPQ